MSLTLKERLQFYILPLLVSSFLPYIESLILFVPVVIGCFISVFHEKQLRLRYTWILPPVVMFLIFITSGGWFFLFGVSGFFDKKYVQMLAGICAAFEVILLVFVLFKSKLRWWYFAFLLLTIPIPYLIGDPNREYGNFIFGFYFLYNLFLLSVIFVMLNRSEILLALPENSALKKYI